MGEESQNRARGTARDRGGAAGLGVVALLSGVNFRQLPGQMIVAPPFGEAIRFSAADRTAGPSQCPRLSPSSDEGSSFESVGPLRFEAVLAAG